jgi:hypothetical protein
MKIYQLGFESHVRLDSGLVRPLQNYFRLDSGLVRPAARGTSALSKPNYLGLSTLPDITATSRERCRGELMRPWVLIETDDGGLTFENLLRSCGGDRARMILVIALMRRACAKVACLW